MQNLKILAFTHKKTPLGDLGRFFLHEENKAERLTALKFSTGIEEICYVATCNRVEFIFTTDQPFNGPFLARFFRHFRPDWTPAEVDFAIAHCEAYEGEVALAHIYQVASSLDSMVIGEREIITQVRKAYDSCREAGLTGDFLRLVIKSTVTTAKQVYTDTRIAASPVSVVSLAFRKLRELNIAPSARILVVGAGETNTSFCKYLAKYGFRNLAVFNRSLENAEKLVASLEGINGRAYRLDELEKYPGGFDVLVTCTAAGMPVIREKTYTALLQGDASRKVIIDLAVPSDLEPAVTKLHSVHLINVEQLRDEAGKNLAIRKDEMVAARQIIVDSLAEFRHLMRTRKLELAMKEVPKKIREIRHNAVNSVFAKEIESLDVPSKDVLEKVLAYMEKKCISIPMVMAKEIILESR